MKGIIKECGKLTALIIGSIIIGTMIMFLLYSIPTGRIYKNAQESVELFSTKRISNWSGNSAYAELSDYTESIMMNNAIYRPYEKLSENAMLNPRIQYEGLVMRDNLVRLLTDGTGGGYTVTYSRYWHGYLAYLIPALLFFNVGEIRVLMMIVQMLLLTVLLYEFGKRDLLCSMLFSIVVLFINPITTALTFQDADIYIITMLFTLVILKYKDWLQERERWKYLFAINGILVAFIDFFTYPLVAFGVPLLTFFLVEDIRGKKAIGTIAKSSFFWIVGYSGMWCGKWIMAMLLTGQNIVAEGLENVQYRMIGTNNEEIDYAYINVLKSMWHAIKEPPMFVLLAITILIMVVYIVKNKRIKLFERESISIVTPILIIGMTPFAYYYVIRNHSIIHPWLEYRELAVTIWALLVTFMKLVNKSFLHLE